MKKTVTRSDMQRMSPDEKMKRVDFFVEADTFAKDQLTIKYGRTNKADAPDWIEDGSGFAKTIGNIGNGTDRPVTVSFNFAAIGDKFVCFYDVISRFADWTMVEDYIKENWPVKYDNGTRNAMCDASNFHNCYHYCCEKSFDNLEAIDEAWFAEMFAEVAEEQSNGEGLEDLVINKKGDSVVIEFSVDAGSYGLHRDNEITIRKDRVAMNLCEMIEGGGLEYGLKRKIEEKIK